MKSRRIGIFTIIGPGILVAATGVGAGDLATGAFAGGHLGVTVLWAVLIGAGLKYTINEGLTRWQLVTGDTLIEGAMTRCGTVVKSCFLLYLLIWSCFVGAALMSACGVAGHAILPLGDPTRDKIIYGLLNSFVALILVKLGGYKVFEKVMAVCIGAMFLIVIATAIALQPAWDEVVRGLLIPSFTRGDAEDLQWMIALIGGVGGTVTVLCYGYWIREEGRQSTDWIVPCRIDLAVGYAMTALFGIAMVIIGSQLADMENAGKPNANLIVTIADRLEPALGAAGPMARQAFFVGAWAAFFSSLLGVWQSVPYLFADVCSLMGKHNAERPVINEKSKMYQWFLYGIATVPAMGLFVDFKQVQKLYAFIGALCIPMLAIVLLWLNGSERRLGVYRNSWRSVILLVAAVVFFAIFGSLSVFK